MLIYVIAAAAFCATLLGGLFAFGLKDKLHLILGFSAGAVIGVTFFDLMPEAFELGKNYPFSVISGVIALGFLGYLVLDRLILQHGHEKERGNAGAGSLSMHSFLDGLGIGLAFHVSSKIGLVVAAAVLAHDFSDGINTVSFILKNKGDSSRAWRWLLTDAIAPVAGVAATFFFSISESQLGFLLALFTGFFLYIGASDLIPESHHSHPVRWTTFATLLGAGTLYLIIRLAGI